MADRRDHQRRSELATRIATWIRQQTGPASVPDEIAKPTVASRILFHLAIRGLARTTAGGWVATPLFLNPVDLVTEE
jgi:hypothetical protein